MGDPVAALVALLQADTAIVAAIAGRVFGGELPAAETPSMPRGAIVLRPSGGISLTGESGVEHDTQRIDVFSYGATPSEAGQIDARAALVLRRTVRVIAAQTLIHWVNSAGGYVYGRDPETEWPRVFRSFQVFYALESIS